jgi:alkylation response protein AidB-like acyl-CoA dehydrogenase
MSYFAEEAATACLGIANLIGVHYLGIAGLMATGNTRLIKRVCRDVIEGERTGRPCTMALAVTEPGAGTDVEEMDLIDKANVACHCRKVPGGYEVNGTKVFISNGALAQWHIIIAYADLKRPSETPVWFIVKTGTEGFTVGRQEVKMGQKACPANELIFDNCFIPDEDVCIDARQIQPLRRNAKDTHMQMLDYVVSATRAAVGAFGTGVARAALEETVRFAAATHVNGGRLIDSEWVQCRLADMVRNVATSRLLYVETNYANGLDGFYKLLQIKPFYYYNKWMPRAYFDRVTSPLLDKPWFMALYRKAFFDWQSEDDFQRTSGWASIAKFAGTDAGIQNCQMAIEIMGAAGLRHSSKVEKCLRDAKLLQIYEGTNQLNRLNTFKCLIHRQVPDAMIFDE